MSHMRLAFRSEGTEWVCYIAKPNTMDAAIRIGSIAMSLAQADDRIKGLFMDTMKLALEVTVKNVLKVDVDRWNQPTPASDSERSGHG